MQIAKVIGTVVSTQKHRKFEGAKLMLVQPLNIDDSPRGNALLAVDGVGDVFIADTGNHALKVLSQAFVPTDPFSEPAAAGSDMLMPVLFTSELVAAVTPTSDQTWLTIDDVVNGVVHFSFAQNTGPARVAHLSLLGAEIDVTQDVGLPTPPTVTAPPDQTAFSGGRTPRYGVFIVGIAPDAGPLAADRGWVRDIWEALRPHAIGSGDGYINGIADFSDERLRHSYGPAKYERLAAIKAEYDPGNVFQRNINIKPA